MSKQHLDIDKIILTLQEWTELANDMLQESANDSNRGEEEQYRQFVKIAQSLIHLLQEKFK